MTKKVKPKNQVTKIIVSFSPCEERIDKAAEIYANAVIEMTKNGQYKNKKPTLLNI